MDIYEDRLKLVKGNPLLRFRFEIALVLNKDLAKEAFHLRDEDIEYYEKEFFTIPQGLDVGEFLKEYEPEMYEYYKRGATYTKTALFNLPLTQEEKRELYDKISEEILANSKNKKPNDLNHIKKNIDCGNITTLPIDILAELYADEDI